MKHSEFVSTSSRLMEAQEPFLVVGAPGIGKTEGLLQAAERVHARSVITHPVISEEVDYRGLPYVTAEGATFLPFGFLRQLVEAHEPTVCIIDDIGQARLSVQAALMQLVHLREVDGTHISDHVTFALATNRREDRAAVQGMVSALLDRCVCVLTLDVDADELARYLLQRNFAPMLAAFVRFRSVSLGHTTKNELEKSPTPRSIVGLGRLLNMGFESAEVLSGAVGPSFATEFIAYRRLEADLPQVEEILRNPKGAKVPKRDARDALFAVTCGLAAKLDAKTLEAGLIYLERVPPEFSVLALKDCAARMGEGELERVPAFAAWVEKHGELLGA